MDTLQQGISIIQPGAYKSMCNSLCSTCGKSCTQVPVLEVPSSAQVMHVGSHTMLLVKDDPQVSLLVADFYCQIVNRMLDCLMY